MSRPIVLLQNDRISFGVSSPTLQEQVILVPSASGQEFYFGTSTLISTTAGGSTIDTLFPSAAAATLFLNPSQTTSTFYTPSLHTQNTYARQFYGDGNGLTNLSFTQFSDRLQPQNFEFNSIPLAAISQFGNLRINNGNAFIAGSTVTTTVHTDSVNTSTLSITGVFEVPNVNITNIANIQSGVVQFLTTFNAYANNFTVATANAITASIGTLSTGSIRTGLVDAAAISTIKVSLFDPTFNSYYDLTANTQRLRFNNIGMASETDIFILQTQITNLNNFVITYSNTNVVYFSTVFLNTSSINSAAANITTATFSSLVTNTGIFSTAIINTATIPFLTSQTLNTTTGTISTLQSSNASLLQATIQTLQAPSASISTLQSSNATLGQAIIQTLQTPSANISIASISTLQSSNTTIQNLQAQQTSIERLGVSSATVSHATLLDTNISTLRVSSFFGPLSGPLVVQNQQLASSDFVSSNATLINISLGGSSKTITLPLTSQQPGRILMIKDIQGQASPSSPLLLQTQTPDVIESFGSSYSIQQPYGFLTLFASPNATWNIIATNQFQSLRTDSISFGRFASTTSVYASTLATTLSSPIIYQQTANQSAFPVGQRNPLRTRVLSVNSNINLSSDDIGSYFLCTNPSITTPFTLNLPPFGSVIDGWSVHVYLDSNSSNFIYVNDGTVDPILIDINQIRQFVFAQGKYYTLGSAPPFGIF